MERTSEMKYLSEIAPILPLQVSFTEFSNVEFIIIWLEVMDCSKAAQTDLPWSRSKLMKQLFL